MIRVKFITLCGCYSFSEVDKPHEVIYRSLMSEDPTWSECYPESPNIEPPRWKRAFRYLTHGQDEKGIFYIYKEAR